MPAGRKKKYYNSAGGWGLAIEVRLTPKFKGDAATSWDSRAIHPPLCWCRTPLSDCDAFEAASGNPPRATTRKSDRLQALHDAIPRRVFNGGVAAGRNHRAAARRFRERRSGRGRLVRARRADSGKIHRVGDG